ncbi:unnamed protein product [Urochloa decumbens]|uniref:MATH domain-containing protein n=1 Tax=Urochloa decumbens TaxID=240449 RepID=A0ABC8WB80_9POAL
MSSSSALIVPAVRTAFRAAREALSHSSTSVNLRHATGTHLLRISGYSLLHGLLPAGDSIDSGSFPAGGHDWSFCFYPNGVSTRSPTASFTLSLADRDWASASAACRVSILDRAGAPAYSAAVKPLRYNRHGPADYEEGRVRDLVGVEELRRKAATGELVDDEDCLRVRCDVIVLKVDTESAIQRYIREAASRLGNR